MGVVKLVRGKSAGIRDPRHGAADGVVGTQEADPIGVDAVVSCGVADEVGEGLAEAEQRPDLLPGALGNLRAGQHVRAAAQVGLDRIQQCFRSPALVIQRRELVDRPRLRIEQGGGLAEHFAGGGAIRSSFQFSGMNGPRAGIRGV